jgi:NO-binding membrane sensor protein with MHYT domain
MILFFNIVSEWDWGIVAASVLIAVVAATAAFWILFAALPLRPDLEILRVLAAVIAAVAVCGMHYTGEKRRGEHRVFSLFSKLN